MDLYFHRVCLVGLGFFFLSVKGVGIKKKMSQHPVERYNFNPRPKKALPKRFQLQQQVCGFYCSLQYLLYDGHVTFYSLDLLVSTLVHCSGSIQCKEIVHPDASRVIICFIS